MEEDLNIIWAKNWSLNLNDLINLFSNIKKLLSILFDLVIGFTATSELEETKLAEGSQKEKIDIETE